MAVNEQRPVPRDGTWDMCHGSWVTVEGGAVELHLMRSGHKEYVADLEEAEALLAAWGLDPGRLYCAGFDEDGDVFRLRETAW